MMDAREIKEEMNICAEHQANAEMRALMAFSRNDAAAGESAMQTAAQWAGVKASFAHLLRWTKEEPPKPEKRDVSDEQEVLDERDGG